MRISDWSSDVCSSDLPGLSGGSIAFACAHDQAHAHDQPGAAELQLQPAGDDARRRAGRDGRRPRRADGLAVDRREQELPRSEEHTSELKSLMRISYAVFCLKKKTKKTY